MDNFALGALLQQAHTVKAAREDDFYRQHQPGPRVWPARLMVGVVVAGFALSILGASVI